MARRTLLLTILASKSRKITVIAMLSLIFARIRLLRIKVQAEDSCSFKIWKLGLRKLTRLTRRILKRNIATVKPSTAANNPKWIQNNLKRPQLRIPNP